MSYRTILTGTDFSDVAEAGARAAYQMARRLGAKRVHKLHVVDHAVLEPVLAPLPAEVEKSIVDEAQSKLTQSMESGEDTEGLELTSEALIGLPSKALGDVAQSLPADLIVISSHGRSGLSRLMLGSVASAVVRSAHCPALIVGPERPLPERFKNILVAVDISEISATVLRHALNFARAEAAPLTILSLFESSLATSGDSKEALGAKRRAQIEGLLEGLDTEGVELKVEVMSKAPPSNVILDLLEMTEADLVVVGTSGHGFWHRMIVGSTATKVINQAKVPALVVPHGTP